MLQRDKGDPLEKGRHIIVMDCKQSGHIAAIFTQA